MVNLVLLLLVNQALEKQPTPGQRALLGDRASVYNRKKNLNRERESSTKVIFLRVVIFLLIRVIFLLTAASANFSSSIREINIRVSRVIIINIRLSGIGV